MQIYQIKFTVILLILILVSGIFAGCIDEEKKSEIEDIVPPNLHLDFPSILPDWKDGEYNDYYKTTDLIYDLNIDYPDLVNLFSIGKSVLDKDIWCIKITNENNNSNKFSCLIDGCIHGVEWESGEACLYLAEYLLINFDNNDTITTILNMSEIYIVPLLNPDGRNNDEVGNENGVDLNRNFDIFFGRLRSRTLRLGPFLGKRLGSYIKFQPNNPHKWWRISGLKPFSEPESCAAALARSCLKDFHEIRCPVPDQGLGLLF